MSTVSSRTDARVLVIDELTLFAEAVLTSLQLRGYQAARVDPAPADRAREVFGSFAPPPGIVVLDLDVGGEASVLAAIATLGGYGAHVVAVTDVR